MTRSRVELVLLLAGAVSCGIAQRTVEEGDVGTGGGGGVSSTAGFTTAGKGNLSKGGAGPFGVGATGGKLGLAGEPDEGTCADDANPAPVHALSRWEYQRTVEALTGVGASTEGGDNGDGDIREGWFNVAMTWNAANAAYVFAEAERQGAAARDGRLLPCDVKKFVDGACAGAFVDDVVGRAFRRPLSDIERSRYVSLFKTGSSNGDMAAGVELVVEAALISPISLHKIYLGNGAASTGQTLLTDFEVASRLSYLLTGGPPDATLRTAAANRQLSNEAAARRLMATPAFDDAIKHFHLQWLGLDRLNDLVSADLPLELLSSMREDTERFVVDVFEVEQTLPSLLLSHRAFVDARLVPRYGVEAPVQGVAAVELDPTRYFGVLTRASTLTRFNNPTQRGKFVRERLLCAVVPPPPPQVPKTIEVLPGQSRREAWQQHMTDPTCFACHGLMDDIGFGFENFDEMGLYRVTDNGLPVDNVGGLTDAEEASGHFVGVGELASKLAGSTVVGKCLTSTWLTYALQRRLDTGDDCAVDELSRYFAGRAQLDMRELLVALAVSSQFRSRDAFVAPTPAPFVGVPGAADTVQARRKLLLDHAIGEAQWLKNGVPKEDLMVLDQYLTALRDLETQLSQAGAGGGPG